MAAFVRYGRGMQPDPGKQPQKKSPEEPVDRSAQDYTRHSMQPGQQWDTQQSGRQQLNSRQPQTSFPTEELSRAPRIESFVAGTLLENQYEIVRRIGTGGMGSVYKCMDKMTSRIVAVKILKQEHAANNKIMQRFQREAQAIAHLEHPHLVKLYSFHFNELMPMLIMEYVDGKPLDLILEHDGALSIERSLKIAIQICDALIYVHKSGIIHRDLKPSNIIIKKSLTGEDVAKVVDFGIAKIKDVQTTTTSTGEIFGSPSYMSPEQAMGKEAGEEADQYALGCVLFECLTGLKPFISDNVLAVMMQHIRDEPPTLKIGSLGKDFSPELEAIVKRMLEKDPERRFSSIAAVRDALTGKKIEPLSRRALTTKSSKIGTGNPFLFATLVSMSTLLAVALVNGGWILFQKAHPLSTQEAKLSAQAIRAEESLSQSPAHDEFGVDAFDSPAALILWLRGHAHEHTVEVLDVYRNSMSLEAMKMISDIPQINVLSLAFIMKMNMLKDLKSSTIQDLNLSSTDVDDTGIKYLSTNLPNLNALNLDGCLHLTTKGYATLREIKSLRSLKVREAILTDAGVKEISMIPELSTLFINSQNNRHITTKTLSYIAEIPNLEGFDFQGMNPDGKFADFKKLKKLKWMVLGNIVFTDNDLKDLGQLKTLEHLRIREANVTEDQAKALIAALPNLTDVDFKDCPEIGKQINQELRKIAMKRHAL
jgi:serine/threonine protein kinase